MQSDIVQQLLRRLAAAKNTAALPVPLPLQAPAAQ
jgi:hypothetical protein